MNHLNPNNLQMLNMAQATENQKEQAAQMLTEGLPLGWSTFEEAMAEIKERLIPENTLLMAMLGEKIVGWCGILAPIYGQYGMIIAYSSSGGEQVLNFMIAAAFVAIILVGLVSKMSADEVGNAAAGGFSNMAFVGVVIGLADVMSLILNQGNIMDTIIYNMTLPLQNISQSWSTVGVAGVVGTLNPLIQSATSKAAFLIPILQPIGEALNIHPQLIIQAFQFGDGFTNLLSPVLGWTVGSAVAAGVPFNKWVKWVFPAVLLFFIVSVIALFILSAIGWTGL